MNNLGHPSTSKQDEFAFQDDEIFDDSTFLANFDNTSFKQATLSENNGNNSINTSALNVSALCCDEEISGYDKLTGRTWIYPTNYPVRDYQFNIIKAAILKNTLVSLPTGLGKTFIAAVIMYNFYRWYPLGKIVFTAPTRPLVAQQIDACYNIIAIPPNDTIEMTGHMPVNARRDHWQKKRVFFATPQVIYNDIKSGICPAEKIRCLVIDEAHRARGNYAYCQIVGTLDEMAHKTYRMLALSATPGSKVDDVINVVKSLHIAHLELRTENCIDVSPYSHSRKINTVIVPLGPNLTQLRQHYVEILDGYARRLKQFNILPQNLGNLSKGRIVMLYKEYQTKDRGQRHAQHNYIMKDFTILIALYHGLELLVKHGSRVFLNFFDEHPEKSWIQADDNLTALLERLRDDLGVNPLSLDRSILPDGTIPELPKDLCFGHPKFDKLKSIILEHFTNAKKKNQDTRAIIFCEYRESVNLVHCLLLQCRPLISPQMFVGQGASGKDGKTVVSQKQQLRVMRSFREGHCNTLVATCVAEEGLDVGSVDLILCFDISTRSPIRLVQRCGRTGRERGGQVYILVTEGREHQTLMDCMRQRDGLNKKILQSKDVENNLYKCNPRMVPRDFTPECQKMFITVDKKNDKKDVAEKPPKKGQKSLRSMLLNKRASSSNTSFSSKESDDATLYITEEEFNNVFPLGYHTKNTLQKPTSHWDMNKETFIAQALETNQDNTFNLTRWLEWQRNLQKIVNVEHSKDTEFLSNILQKCDVKRLESSQMANHPVIPTQEILSHNIAIPALQSPAKTTALQSPIKAMKQIKKKLKAPAVKSPGKNYGDIRALFSTATKSTKNYTKLINDLGVQNDGSVSTTLLNLLVDLNLNVDKTDNGKHCYICQYLCDCKAIKSLRKNNSKPEVITNFLADPILPDIDLIDEINAEAIIKCNKDFQASQKSINCDIKSITVTSKYDNANCSNNFDLEFDLDALDEVVTPEPIKENTVEINTSNDKNFDLGDIDDIFADSSPEEAIENTIKAANKVEQLETIENKPQQTQEALGFFGLDSIDDIFADYEDDNQESSISKIHEKASTSNKIEPKEPVTVPTRETEIVAKNPKETNKTIIIESDNVPNSVYPVSPSILSGKVVAKEVPTSPILCSQPRKFQLSIKKNKHYSSTPKSSAKKKLILPDPGNNNVIVIDDEKEHKPVSSNVADITDKSMFTITQIVEMINKTNDKSIKESEKHKIDISAKEDERSSSPILLTQADKKRSLNLSTSKNNNKNQNFNKSSLIILDSDSDSEDTQTYNIDDAMGKMNTNIDQDQSTNNQTGGKRKFDHDDSFSIASSPYFHKKPKLDNVVGKPLTLQEKILAALTSNKASDSFKKDNDFKSPIKPKINDQTNLQVTVSQPNIFSQKENHNPLEECKKSNSIIEENEIQQSPLDMLQIYRRESKLKTLRSKFDSIFKKSPKKLNQSPKKNKVFEESDEFVVDERLLSPSQERISANKENAPVKRKIFFNESDDDFVDDKNSSRSPMKPTYNRKEMRSTTNHKVRKKKRDRNSLLDFEASLSDDGADSGDELSDDSVGSIADFLDDGDVNGQEDIAAVYLKSVRSPLKKNGFKIPELPSKYRKEDIFSQFVEEDAYEMDSFCVDSHIGLTQVNDVSELELAEIVLEEKRRNKRNAKLPPPSQNNGESPLVRRKNRNCKRQITSDSDDSS